jgi:HEAT repeat protein
MTAERPEVEARRARVRAADEEARYRAAADLDGAAPGDRALLLELLADPSWRVRSGAVERLGGLADPRPFLPALVAALGAGPTVGARDAAASALARIGLAAVPALVEQLGGADPDLRQAAAGVLGAVGDRRAAAALAARLADPDVNVRAAAAEALGKIGGPEAAGTLVAAIDTDDPTLRLAAVEALAALRICPPARRVEALLADRALRRPAYRALGACDEPEAAALLARGLAETARGAREAALAGIGAQRARRPAVELAPLAAVVRAAAERDTGVADACAAAVRAEEPSVAVGAVTVLGWIGGPRHVDALLRVAEDDRLRPLVEDALEAIPESRELRAALAEALGGQGALGRITALAVLARLGSPAALESVVREASDPDAHVQAEAIAALGRLGDARAVSPLAGLLGDDSPGVSNMAANALVRIGQRSREGTSLVLTAARDRAGASPSAALYRVLGALGVVADVPLLLGGLRSAAAVQRIAAAGAIAALARRRVLRCGPIPDLLAALVDPAWAVRAAAARAFVQLARTGRAAGRAEPCAARAADPAGEPPRCEETLGALHAAVADPEPAVRASALEAIGACGRTELAPFIAALAGDGASPPVVAVSALHALLELGPPPADALARAARHVDPEVVKEAVVAAARLPGPDGERLVREATRSARWDVRRAAARAMLERGDPRLADDASRLAADEADPLVARAFAEAAEALRGR